MIRMMTAGTGAPLGPHGFRRRGVGGPWHPALWPPVRVWTARWAEQELGGAPLRDVRLSRRLVRCAQVQAQAPQASFPGAAQSDRALVKGCHRLIDRPDDTQVTPDRILVPHRARTPQRMQQAGRVLCVQDGTALNFADHPGCAGLIGRNRASEGTLGLHMHSLPVLDAQGCRWGCPTSSTTRITGAGRPVGRRA